MNEDKMSQCAKMKAEYFIKCVKMLYNWSCDNEEKQENYINALGLNEYKTAILGLLRNKARINSKIDFILNYLLDNPVHDDRINALNELKIILLVCNKIQAIKIYSIVARTAQDIKQELNILETF